MRIEIKNLSFSYNSSQKVLDDISLNLIEGEFVSILGCNGAGKTTLFKSMLGFLTPQKGTILLDKQPLSSYKPKEIAQKIAYIPQLSYSTFDYTVFNTVLMGTTCQISTLSTPKKREEEAVNSILANLGISHLAHKKINEISGGERQLALIARALAQKAKILILDEITANLDYGNQIKVLSMISKLTEQGYTILFSTHNPEGALIYADRILLLDSGKISFSDTPEKLAATDLLSSLYKTDLYIEKLSIDNKSRYICIPR